MIFPQEKSSCGRFSKITVFCPSPVPVVTVTVISHKQMSDDGSQNSIGIFTAKFGTVVSISNVVTFNNYLIIIVVYVLFDLSVNLYSGIRLLVSLVGTGR